MPSRNSPLLLAPRSGNPDLKEFAPEIRLIETSTGGGTHAEGQVNLIIDGTISDIKTVPECQNISPEEIKNNSAESMCHVSEGEHKLEFSKLAEELRKLKESRENDEKYGMRRIPSSDFISTNSELGSLGSGGSTLSEMDCSGLVGVTINQDENNLIREMQREINEKNEEIADLRARIIRIGIWNYSFRKTTRIPNQYLEKISKVVFTGQIYLTLKIYSFKKYMETHQSRSISPPQIEH